MSGGAEPRPSASFPAFLAFLLAALACFPALLPRARFDARDRVVSLVVDFQGLRDQGRLAGRSTRAILEDLEALGAQRVALSPYSLQEMRALGWVRMGSLEGAPALLPTDAMPGRLRPLFLDNLSALTRSKAPAPSPLLEELSLFFDPEELEALTQSKLEPALRVGNHLLGTGTIPSLLSQAPEGSQVIFAATEALGYPAQLRPAAQLLAEKKASIGWVEFSGQRGVETLAKLGGLRLEPTHSIPDKELEKLPLSRVRPRWVRSIRERRIRNLYLRVFPPHNLPYAEATAYEANLRYFRRVRDDLLEAGYQLGFPLDPKAELALAPRPYLALASLGAALALAWLLSCFAWLPLIPLVILAIGLCFGLLGLYLVRGQVVFLNLLALLAATSSAAASILSLPAWIPSRRSFGTFLWAPFLVLVAASASGVLIFTLLSDPGFLVRELQFRGVKLVYLVPLGWIALYWLRHWDPFRSPLSHAQTGLLALAALAGLIYLARSGNFSPLPASSSEYALRDRLEAVLPYRPRTKESAIGYPLQGFFLASLWSQDCFYPPWASLGAGVAAVSATNSFCHLKTPFRDSVGRGLIGILAGLPLSLLVALAYHLFLRRGRRRTWVLAGFAGFGNFGDDWITENLLRAWEARAPEDVEIVLLCPDPDLASKRFRVPCISRTDPFAILDALRHAERFATGPGGLLQDQTSTRSLLYYLGLHLLARLHRVEHTAFLFEGIGPLSGRQAKSWVRFYLSTASLALVRDPESQTLAGGSPGLGLDAAFLALPRRREESPEEGAGVSLVLRPLPEAPDPLSAGVALGTTLIQWIRSQELEVEALLLAHPEHDQELAHALCEHFPELSVLDLASKDGRAALRRSRGLISGRLHPALFARALALPTLALGYAPKVSSVLEPLGVPVLELPFNPEAEPLSTFRDQLEAGPGPLVLPPELDTRLERSQELLDQAYGSPRRGVGETSSALGETSMQELP